MITVARIGDTVLATPVLRALKQAYPSGHLTVLAHPKRLDALQNLPFIDELHGMDKARAFWSARFGSFRYDVALVFGREPALLDYALRVSRRVIANDELVFRADERLERLPLKTGEHAVIERLRLLEPLGIQATDRRLAFAITPEERRRAKESLGIEVHPLIGFQMSSFRTKAHRDWPVERFSQLADAIVARYRTSRFVVLGDDTAEAAAVSFMQRHGSRTLLRAGRTTLRESAALIGELDLYVGVDTGPTHIAGALGVPMVALYHCLYPGRLLAPLDHPACRVIEHPRNFETDCEAASMDDIDVAPVLEAALQLLRERPVVRGAGL